MKAKTLGTQICKNTIITSKYSLRKKIHKTEYILTLLGSFDTLGLTADLNDQMKSKLDET